MPPFTRRSYSAVSIGLHWGIALLVATQIVLINRFEAFEHTPAGSNFLMLHKSVGILILLLTLTRLAWRTREPWMPMPGGTPGWQALLARGSHVGFYVVLLAMPLLGWWAVSAAHRPLALFGLIPWFDLPAPGSPVAARTAIQIHGALAKVLYLLVGLHLLGVVKHLVVDHDDVPGRMLPFPPFRRR